MEPPPRRASVETRERLLDAAERLFAAGGLAGTSVRAITAEAGVNVAAVHYHFGSKEGLLRAVFARRVAPINEERRKRLDELEAAGTPDAEAVLACFVRPAVEFVSAHPELGDLASLLYSEPADAMRPLLQEIFGATTERFAEALARALPGLPAPLVATRFHFVVGALVHVIAGRGPLELPPGVVAPELLRFLAAGMAAAPGPTAPLPADSPSGAPRRSSP